MSTTFRRLGLAVTLVVAVFAVGTIGYLSFGLSLVDAMYQTVTTISTVGFRELHPFSTAEKWFTMGIIVTGVGTALYTLTLGVQVVVEGQLRDLVGRRRMDKKIADMRDHVVVCGWGRVGKAVADDLAHSGQVVVIVDSDAGAPPRARVPDRRRRCHARRHVAGGRHRKCCGIDRCAHRRCREPVRHLVRPVDQPRPVHRRPGPRGGERGQAGACRRRSGGQPAGAQRRRMASFVVRPHIAEFVDVVMHERSMEFRMQEVEVTDDSPLAGKSLRDADLRQRANVLVLALRHVDGTFTTNPDPDTVIEPKQVIIAVGTGDDLARLEQVIP